MYKTMELLYMVVVLFQGYCLQYFLGSFLESRWKSRWNGLCVAVLYTAELYGLSWVFNQASVKGYDDYGNTVWKMALSLCILFVLAMCFYKALRPVSVFLVVTFQAVADISRYTTAILLAKISVVDIWNWCVEKGIITSDKALVLTLNGSILAVQILQYVVIALLSILYGVKLFQDMVYRNKIKSEMVILKNQVRSLQEHMEEMERIYSEIWGMPEGKNFKLCWKK